MEAEPGIRRQRRVDRSYDGPQTVATKPAGLHLGRLPGVEGAVGTPRAGNLDPVHQHAFRRGPLQFSHDFRLDRSNAWANGRRSQRYAADVPDAIPRSSWPCGIRVRSGYSGMPRPRPRRGFPSVWRVPLPRRRCSAAPGSPPLHGYVRRRRGLGIRVISRTVVVRAVRRRRLGAAEGKVPGAGGLR